MKKLFVLLLTCIFCLDQSFAQVVILKKGEGYSGLDKNYTYDKNITIILRGYNPFATRLNGKGVDIDLSYETPDLLKQVFKEVAPGVKVEDSTKNDEKEIAKNDSIYKRLQMILDGGPVVQDLKANFSKSYNEFIGNTQKIYLAYQLEDHIKKIISDPSIDSATARKNIDSLIAVLAKDKDLKPNANVDSLKVDVLRTNILNLLAESKKNYSALKLSYELLNKLPASDTHKISGTLKDKDGNVELTLKDVTTTVKGKLIFKEEYDYATKRMGQLMNDTVWSDIFYKVNRAIDLRNQVIATPWELVYVVGPLPEDVKEISLKVTNTKDETILDYGKFYIHSYGQLKVDVSAGYFLSLSGNEKYTAVPDNTGKLIGIKKQETELVNHALGVQFNFYKKPKNEIGWGGSAGFSIPVDGNLNFYLGPSILFNSKSRIILTAGLTATRLKVLDDGNLKDENGQMEYSFINENDTEIKYNDTYRLRPFVSITYNMASVKKD